MKVEDEDLIKLRLEEKELFKKIEWARKVALAKIITHFNIDVGDKVSNDSGKIGFISKISFWHRDFDTISYSAVGIKKDGTPSLNSAGLYDSYDKLTLISKKESK